MRIALLGTRGAGYYGGFETCVAELAPRLSEAGHEVAVYTRRWSPARAWRHPGVDVVTLPSIPTKNLDTITHSALSTIHAAVRRPDVAIVFGVGNAPFAWLLRKRGVPVVFNVDGLDRARAKWGRFAKWYLTKTEHLAPRAADVLVTDARTIEDYFLTEYSAASEFIPYGAPDGPVGTTDVLDAEGITPGEYILYVSRLEPENNAHVVIEAHQKAQTDLPLVIVGGSAYSDDYERTLRAAAHEDVRFLGFVFGDGYRELQSHAAVYVQATEVGGTHPALVEAMGFGNAVLALDTPEHREVLADAGTYYGTVEELAIEMARLSEDEDRRMRLAAAATQRAREEFSWDAVARTYARICDSALRR